MPWNSPPSIIYLEEDNITSTCDIYTNGEKGYPYTMTSNCEKTLGDEADPLYGIFQAVFGVIYFTFFILFGLRLRDVAGSKDSYFMKLNALSFIGAFLLILGIIDANGYRGLLPFQIYYICDEVAAATLLCGGIIMIDSIVRLGNAVQSMKPAAACKGLGDNVVYFSWTFMWIAYLGFQILAMIDTDQYMIWTSMKGFFGGINLVVITAKVTIAAKQILGACDKLPEEKVNALKAKFNRCQRVAYGVAFILVATSIMDLMAEDTSWRMGAGFDGWFFWVIFRFVFMAAFYVFYVTNKTASSKKVGHNATTGHTTAHTTMVSEP
ncbi:hypothetical protein TrLO_g5211 [Triparma laevis f. longispina]|uniref:Uncharacterized protein n=1 Tax=Triparma laevis f. longispina TaxID=1714387 RepID=A0A9W7A9I1_9STRA|nr:hypothetical protein TrLO_g5211 [Triparma laevis f. longispina]